MKKIPLEPTIVGSYKFLFTRILSILGTVWLPTLLMVGLCAGIVYLVVPHGWWQGQFPVLDETKPDPAVVLAFMQPFMAAYFPVMLIVLVMCAMTTVGLMRLALDQKKSAFIFFSLGGDVWRLVAAWVLAVIIMTVVYVALIVAAIVIVAIVRPHVPAGPGIGLFILMVITFGCVLIYGAVRLVFFLPAVVTAEHSVGLRKSWKLGGGNFWRIFVVFLAVVIPVGMVANMVLYIGAAPYLIQFVRIVAHAKPDLPALIHAMLPFLPIIVAVQLVHHIALQGLTAGAVANAYKARTAPEEVKE